MTQSTQVPFSSQHHSFDIRLAQKYGIEEAILIHHFQHWVSINARGRRNFHDGKTWSYQTYKAIAENFPYWSYEQIKYLCQKLVIKGILVKGNYNKRSFDNTNWYAFVDEKAFGIEENSKRSYERENSPSIGKFPSPIPDTKPTDALPIKEKQHKKKVADNPVQLDAVVLSFEAEKREALSRFCLSQRKLRELLTYELNQIRDAIDAFDQFAASNHVSNPVGWLTNAIRGAWKPNLSKEEVQKIKQSLTPQQECTRQRVLGELKQIVHNYECRLKDGVKIKLTSHMLFMIQRHGQTAIELWDPNVKVYLEYFIENNRKDAV